MLDYYKLFQTKLAEVRQENRYRDFKILERDAKKFPKAIFKLSKQEVTLWCINDYLGMSRHQLVIEAAIKSIQKNGVGSGGTRNIGGNNLSITRLETEIATLHQKEAALVFTSGYVSNDASLTSLAKLIPGVVFLSDELNHASIITGIRNSKAEKYIYRHLDVEHLELILQKLPIDQPKIIVFEATYSMNGFMAPVREIAQLAKKYNALTYLDEVHSVGLYGVGGAGIANMLACEQEIDIIQGTFAKAYGVVGGYIAAKQSLIEAIKLTASGFIFTTSLPPAITDAATASIKYLKTSSKEREKHQEIVKATKQALLKRAIPVLENQTHIIPIIIGDPKLARQASELLLSEYNIFLQHINFPTVSRGTERLRITPTPMHDQKMIEHLADSLAQLFAKLGIKN